MKLNENFSKISPEKKEIQGVVDKIVAEKKEFLNVIEQNIIPTFQCNTMEEYELAKENYEIILERKEEVDSVNRTLIHNISVFDKFVKTGEITNEFAELYEWVRYGVYGHIKGTKGYDSISYRVHTDHLPITLGTLEKTIFYLESADLKMRDLIKEKNKYISMKQTGYVDTVRSSTGTLRLDKGYRERRRVKLIKEGLGRMNGKEMHPEYKKYISTIEEGPRIFYEITYDSRAINDEYSFKNALCSGIIIGKVPKPIPPKIQGHTKPIKIQKTPRELEVVQSIEHSIIVEKKILANLLKGVVTVNKDGKFIKRYDEDTGFLISDEVYEGAREYVLNEKNQNRSWSWFKKNKCNKVNGRFILQ